jgi:hypothetical protein
VLRNGAAMSKRVRSSPEWVSSGGKSATWRATRYCRKCNKGIHIVVALIQHRESTRGSTKSWRYDACSTDYGERLTDAPGALL